MSFEQSFIEKVDRGLIFQKELGCGTVNIDFLVSKKRYLVDRLPQEWLVEPAHKVVWVGVVHDFDEPMRLQKFDQGSNCADTLALPKRVDSDQRFHVELVPNHRGCFH